jgi:hypothetical protein
MGDIQEAASICLSQRDSIEERLAAASNFLDIESTLNHYKRDIERNSQKVEIILSIVGIAQNKKFYLNVLEVVKLQRDIDWRSRRS